MKYGSKANPDANAAMASMTSFFEGLGVLVNKGYIDKTLVDDLCSGYVLRIWDKVKPIADEFRKRYNWSAAFKWIEYMSGEVRGIAESQHPELRSADLKSPD